ncbi:MAG: 50S ribosomal protein L25 [Candidatus Tantalella remota]|nr:50S ribosomal protein L25 [Candidatus Tantalella remota]
MMEKVTLKSLVREGFGKGSCKHLRKEGQIPAVVYSDGKESVSIQVDAKELWHALHTDAGENAIITMDVAGGEKDIKKTVMVKEIQYHPVNDDFLHMDFKEISLRDKLKVKVPLLVKGEAIGVKDNEGILSQDMWEIEVECLPTEIPENLEVQVDELDINDSLHIKDITPPADVVILDDPEHVIVSVKPPQAEEEPEEEAVEGEEEPEVIKKGKGEEEEEAAEAAPAEGGAEEQS